MTAEKNYQRKIKLCKKCKKELPKNWPHKRCQSCYDKWIQERDNNRIECEISNFWSNYDG